VFERVRRRGRTLLRRARRIERREVRSFARWIETTDNLVHLSVLVFVPLLIALVTVLSNAVRELSFLLFPPLASGTYTLFANPEGRYASTRKFVGGLTLGAVCGWAAVVAAGVVFGVGVGADFSVHPTSAALALALTGGVSWALDVEEPAAFSTALLTLIVEEAQPFEYVASVFLASLLVAGAFLLWRERFYERRARYLYGAVSADDHVLVPVKADADPDERVGLFGARLAAAHEAGKVVLLGLVEGGDATDAGEDDDGTAEATAGSDLADELEGHAARIRTRTGVPCEVVVASGDALTATVETARDTNCDLVVTPYETRHGVLSSYVRGVFDSPFDAVAFRSTRESTRWKRVLVPVSRPGDTAHAMIDFASRLAGRSGEVSVCTCIGSNENRRRAEETLANLVETVEGDVETRVARADVEDFIAANAEAYDAVLLGSSGDRSAASRFVSRPTFERIRNVDTDVAVVDRGRGD
jgi:hypothetical protein